MDLKRGLMMILEAVYGMVGVILGMRILFMLAAANPATPFVMWVDAAAREVVAPFRNIFASYTLGGGSVVDSTAIVALVFYTIGFYALKAFIEAVAHDVHGQAHLPI